MLATQICYSRPWWIKAISLVVLDPLKMKLPLLCVAHTKEFQMMWPI